MTGKPTREQITGYVEATLADAIDMKPDEFRSALAQGSTLEDLGADSMGCAHLEKHLELDPKKYGRYGVPNSGKLTLPHLIDMVADRTEDWQPIRTKIERWSRAQQSHGEAARSRPPMGKPAR